jgi:hypothetical protein
VTCFSPRLLPLLMDVKSSYYIDRLAEKVRASARTVVSDYDTTYGQGQVVGSQIHGHTSSADMFSAALRALV